ncbi:MAG TPA: ABC transporter ATP-binding protein [Anaerolineaceae bacterium]|nr:ABC transporter ATP-binding protein [Anaerolineaceae bacterium]
MLLQVENLSAGYGDIKRPSTADTAALVLRGVSFELHEGEILAVIGPNGAGKTSLVRALTGILPLPADGRHGRVRVGGQDLAHLSPAERARRMAVVPQARQLPSAFTVWETVLIGRTAYLNWLGQPSEQDEELARNAMQRTNILPLAQRRIDELSGGEQQRVLLARALAQNAPLLLLDEPTSHLDFKYQFSLLEQLRQLSHGTTGTDKLGILVVLHDLNLVARYADRVALLVGGQLHALGTPEEVLAAPLLSQAYDVPLQVMRPEGGGFPFIGPRD